MVHRCRSRFRVLRVIVLMLFDRMPKKEVKFTRATFSSDKNTCQYCGKVRSARLNLDHAWSRDKAAR